MVTTMYNNNEDMDLLVRPTVNWETVVIRF